MNSIKFKYDIVFVSIIIALPFLFYTYLFFPAEQDFELFGLVIKSGYYESVDVLFWNLFNCIISLILFSIWFITCKNWWRFAILLLIYEKIGSLISLFYDMFNMKTNEFLILFISIIFSAFLVFLSKKLNYFSFSKSINQQLDEEIDNMMEGIAKIKRKDFIYIKLRLTELRKEKQQLNKMEYLVKLIKLRDDFRITPNK